MRLSGEQIGRLHSALLDAFPSRAALYMLVRVRLDQNLDAIADGNSLSTAAFNLIQWAESQGLLRELLQAARKENPGNLRLRELLAEIDPLAVEPERNQYEYDVYVSYALSDRRWVKSELIPRLELAQLRVVSEYNDVRVGESFLPAIERTVRTSRHILLVMSPAWLEAEWMLLERLFAYSLESSIAGRIIPIVLRPVEIPVQFRAISSLDFTKSNSRDLAWTRLLRALGATLPVDGNVLPRVEEQQWLLRHPLPGGKLFINRQKELLELNQWVTSDAAHPLLLLLGPDGMGKSALVSHWLYTYVSSSEWPYVFLWSFNADRDFDRFLSECLDYLVPERTEIYAWNSSRKADLLITTLQAKKVLLILDGMDALLDVVERNDVHSGSKKHNPDPVINRLFHRFTHEGVLEAKVLLTSRLRPLPLEHGAGHLHVAVREITVGPVDSNTAVEILVSLGIFGSDEELGRAAEICDNQPASLLLLASLANSDRDQPGKIGAPSVQVELNARVLESFCTINDICSAHRQIVEGSLGGSASALLRRFERISRDVDVALQQDSIYNRRLALSALEDRLDSLAVELPHSPERFAARFFSVTTRWRKTIAEYIAILTRDAEEKQEIDDPYIIGVPLTAEQKIFVGRAELGKRIEQLLTNRRRPPLLLYGQRRMGKTSLLYNLGVLLPSTIVPFFVDLQGPASQATDKAGFLYNLSRGMIESARYHRNLELPILSRETLAGDPFTVFDEWLDSIERILGSNSAILCLDEFEALDRAFQTNPLQADSVLGMLRHLIQHRPKFKVLLAGSHPLDEFQRWSSYLINVQTIHIGYLKEAEARQLIEEPIPDFPLRYDADACQRVLSLTRCHPYLVQLLCAEIVALKNEQPPAVRRIARIEDVETSILPALESGSLFFADIQANQVDAAGVALLRFLATKGEGAVISQNELERVIGDDACETLTRLQRRELIENTGYGYSFEVELIRRWFFINK